MHGISVTLYSHL